MNYETAMYAKISQAEARQEIEEHDCLWADFVTDHGDRPTYLGAEILHWLNY
jgi:hypothetical protein